MLPYLLAYWLQGEEVMFHTYIRISLKIVWSLFESVREEVTPGWRKYVRSSFKICTLHQILLGLSSEGELDGQDM
jgi:hypothetical protein